MYDQIYKENVDYYPEQKENKRNNEIYPPVKRHESGYASLVAFFYGRVKVYYKRGTYARFDNRHSVYRALKEVMKPVDFLAESAYNNDSYHKIERDGYQRRNNAVKTVGY